MSGKNFVNAFANKMRQLDKLFKINLKNFRDTKCKISREIAVNDKWIGTLEVCYLEKKPEFEE